VAVPLPHEATGGRPGQLTELTDLSRLWENAKGTTPPYEWTLRPRVVDIRDEGAVAGVSIRSDGDAVVMTLPLGTDNDLEVIFSREMARLVADVLGNAAGG